MRVCQSMQENACMWTAMLNDIAYVTRNCPVSCNYRKYNALVDSIYSNDSTIGLTFASNQIATYKEYLIYDFAGMVGSVGGNFGLFVGWSFYDILIFLISALMKRM